MSDPQTQTQTASTTLPVFDTEGTLRDIPQEQLPAAVKAGGMPAVRFQTPDKNPDGSPVIRFVPANRTADAYQAGGKLLPLEQQDVKHPGFWSTLGSDLWGMAKPFLTVPTTMDEMVQRARLMEHMAGTSDPNEFNSAVATNESEKQAGYGPVYRYAAAPLARGVGVNVSGMEQSAAEGDVGGVVGHAAAVPVAMAVTEGARAGGSAAGSALSKSSLGPTLKAAASTVRAMATPENIATAVGGGVGAYAGHFVGEPLGLTAAGGALGKYFGKSLTARLADALAKDPVEWLDKDPGGKFPTATPEQLNPSLVSPARSLPGQIGPEVIRPPASPIPARSGLMLTGEAPKAPGQAGQLVDLVTGPETKGSPAGPSPAQPAPASSQPIPQRVTPAQAAAARGAAARAPVSGEGALRAVLNNESHENLMTMAKDRGIDVSQESNMTPAAAKKPLIDKIADDYSDNELDDFRDVYSYGGQENTPMRISGQKPSPQVQQALSDLTDIMQKSLDVVKAKKAGAAAATETTASPKMLLNRWGVDPDSFVAGRAQTRGFSPQESEASLQALQDRYSKGQPVDPVEEIRDANNNLIEVDGRGRALAAHRAGVERIPIIVRRVPGSPTQ